MCREVPVFEYHVHAGRMRKDCIGQYMKEHGASTQAIAFMRFVPVPAAISEVKSYPVAAVVHADMSSPTLPTDGH